MHRITCRALLHRGEERLFLDSPNSNPLNALLHLLPGARWSKTHKQWHLPLTEQSYLHLSRATNGIAIIDNSAIVELWKEKFTPSCNSVAASASLLPARVQLLAAVKTSLPAVLRIAPCNAHVLPLLKQQLVLKAYSASTIRTYGSEMAQFLVAARSHPVDDFDVVRIKAYMQYCFEQLNISENTMHSRINTLKFYYEQVLYREKFFWEIPRPKKQLQLPRFFSQDEVAAIINTTANIKHKTMLMLCYSTGLRVSEVVALKTRNIDSKRMCILVQQAKGKKDRIVPLSPVLLVMLREYATGYTPSVKGFLFEGIAKGEAYSARSLQEVLHQAKERALVFKPGGVHALRHSFATHLLDRGTDISMIQKLLGHSDIKTTLRYLHTTNKDIMNIVSPLDSLSLKK
jgi:integrase/recombinase XerD